MYKVPPLVNGRVGGVYQLNTGACNAVGYGTPNIVGVRMRQPSWDWIAQVGCPDTFALFASGELKLREGLLAAWFIVLAELRPLNPRRKPIELDERKGILTVKHTLRLQTAYQWARCERHKVLRKGVASCEDPEILGERDWWMAIGGNGSQQSICRQRLADWRRREQWRGRAWWKIKDLLFERGDWEESEPVMMLCSRPSPRSLRLLAWCGERMRKLWLERVIGRRQLCEDCRAGNSQIARMDQNKNNGWRDDEGMIEGKVL